MTDKLDAVIFDRDGTLFSVQHHMKPEGKGPKSWQAYNDLCEHDAAIPAVAALFHLVSDNCPGVKTIITSGREDHTRPGMEAALIRENLVPDYFFMRKTGDNRKDSLVKLEMFAQKIEPHFNILFVVDDRQQVVDAWRSVGLHVIQVTDPGVDPVGP